MKRVLIVGNSKPTVTRLQRALTSLKYNVVGVARTGAESLAMVGRLAPDIVLIDGVILGEPDATGTARIIREGLDTPVLLLGDHASVQPSSHEDGLRAHPRNAGSADKGALKEAIEDTFREWESAKASTSFYEDLVENTYDLVHVEDGRGNIIYVNRAVTEILGYEIGEVIGRNIRDFVTPETYRSLEGIFRGQLKGNAVSTLEIDVHDRQGGIRTFETRERLIWEGGRIVEVHGILRDITDRKRVEKELVLLNRLKEELLGSYDPSEKLTSITEKVVEIFNADFARIWIIKPGDLCSVGCSHAAATGADRCLDRSRCLHLVASSGRYTHIDGKIHRRVPFDAYKIGRVASGKSPKFLTNDLAHDPQVHDHAWAKKLGLASFAGYRLLSKTGEPIGVLALFSKHPISPQEDSLLEDLANTTAQVIRSARTEEVLRESEERYRTLFENATFGIYHALPEGKLLRVNKALARMMGYESSEDMVSSVKDIARDIYVDPSRREGNVSGVIKTTTGWEVLEEQFRRKDGSTIRVRLHVRPVRVPDDGFQYLEGFVEDITERFRVEEERRNAEEAIRRDQELKEKILQTAAVGIAFAENREITWANAAMEHTFGFTDPSHYVGKDTSILYASETEYKRIGKLVYEGAASSGVIESVARFKRIDGEEFLGLIRTSFVDPREPFKEIVVSISDITERTRTEQALRESEQRYRLLAENADDIIFTMDASLRFTYISPSVTRVRGFTVEEAMVQTPAEALTPDSFDVAMASFDEVLAAEAGEPSQRIQTRRLELEGTCKDGSTIWTETTFTVLRDRDGKFDGVLGITRDITERRRAEAALAESEEKYRVVVENAHEGIAVIQDDVFVFANGRLLSLFGYTEQEFFGRPYTDFLIADDHQEAESEYRRKMAGNDSAYLSLFRVITKRGELRWTEVSGIQIAWNGQPALLIFVRDVTERKKIEQALIQSEAKYRELIENAIDLIFTVDPEGTFLEVNESLLREMGYSREDIGSVGFRAFVHPDEMGIALEAYGRGKRGLPDAFEMRGKKKDGTYGWYSFVTRPILDINGAVEYVHCIGRNITDRKAAEEALLESEEKFRGMFETSRDFMFISSLDGKILNYNQAAKEFFGYSEEEIRDINITDLYANPDERDGLMEGLLEKGFMENREIRLKRKDGTVFEALITSTVRRDRQGNIIGIQGTARDVTTIKRMERQLLQAEKLSGLGTMISGVAHEINNPLTAIMGNAELMLMNSSTSAGDRKSLEIILHESERAARIVGGLLTFAREHAPERRMIIVNDVITESLRLRDYSLRVSNIKTELFLSDDLPLTFADPHQLQQVFSNIINNARDALTEAGGGTLTIRTLRSDGRLLIEFQDDGAGIPPENRQKLFNPFFTTKDIGKGTGLGLSIAYGIIEEHNGKIEVESEPGRGTTFIVELPIVDGAESGVTRTTATPKEVRGEKSILVIDDEKDVLEFLSQALARYGYVVQTASAAEEALVLMEDRVFDAIVADIKMPGMGGKKMHEYVRSHIPGAAEKIVFITGDILGDETQAFIQETGSPCIKKPFKISDLIDRLNDIIRP
jgi:PAS domain S-box-containing protein